MVKAGKHSLLMASRHRRFAGSRKNHTDARQLPAICLKNDGRGSTESQTVLNAIRTEFCAKYKTSISECKSTLGNSNTESAQLRTLYRKLREVIPTLSQRGSKKVTSLDVVLGAIDYIRDLHNMLEETLPINLQEIDTVTKRLPVSSNTTTGTDQTSTLIEVDNRRLDLTMDTLSDEDLPIH